MKKDNLIVPGTKYKGEVEGSHYDPEMSTKHLRSDGTLDPETSGIGSKHIKPIKVRVPKLVDEKGNYIGGN